MPAAPTSTSTRSRRVPGATAGALALLAATAGCSAHHHQQAASSPSVATSGPIAGPAPVASTAAGAVASPVTAAVASSTSAALPAARATTLAQALTSADRQTASAALEPAVRAGYLKKPFALLPAGSKVSIDTAHMDVHGNLATVPATVTGPQPGTWTLLLTKVKGQWLVYGTRKAP